MKNLYTHTPRPVNYHIHINGGHMRVRATHREMLVFLRVLLRRSD